MASKLGNSSFNNPKRAKAAYLRRHGIKPAPKVQVDAVNYHEKVSRFDDPIKAAARQNQQLGVSRVAEHLFDSVTMYHAQIGANVDKATLQALEGGMVEEAQRMISTQQFSEALNLFTHALAISEKTDDATSQASIVNNIGYCLHCLGEFEAAKAYYEQALAALRKIRPSLLDRTVSLMGGSDVNERRALHIKERLFEISLGRRPTAGEYLDGAGRRVREHGPLQGGVDSATGGDGGGGAYDEDAPPAWLAAAGHEDAHEDADEAAAEAHGEAPMYGSNVTPFAEAPAEARDNDEAEAARKEWFQYHMQEGEWDLAGEMVATEEEAQALEQAMEQRAGRPSAEGAADERTREGDLLGEFL